MANEQSAKKRQMSVAVRKVFLSLRHRFGERTSCEGRLTTQFRLVNSGKILSRDERRQMSTPYCYRAWTAFPHFLIWFTRAIQRNEKGWDTLFCYALPVAPLRVIARRNDEAIQRENWKTNEYNEEKISTNWALVWKMTIFAASWGRNPDSTRKAFLESQTMKSPILSYEGQGLMLTYCFCYQYGA